MRCDRAVDGRRGADAACTRPRAPASRSTLVVLDAQMPGMDGIELAAAIRRRRALRGARLMMLTSTARPPRGRARGWRHRVPAQAGPRARACSTAVAEALGGAPAPRRARAVAGAAPPATRAARTLLVAEDNAVNQQRDRGDARQARAHGRVAGNGARGARDARRTAPTTLVFMDCQMPEIDGYEATRRDPRRASADGARIPIIAMTAHAMKGDRERCLAAGMDDYLSKPLRPDELDDVLERWLGTAAAGARTAPAVTADPGDALVDAPACASSATTTRTSSTSS